ncbi:hypothetical protein F5Y15DRAFT_398554 [Xylariaceae sp. FL0016]|nr:hypothetical protein F5Y15DRAFT_398554 [Xylariaceae sp. FL0016]
MQSNSNRSNEDDQGKSHRYSAVRSWSPSSPCRWHDVSCADPEVIINGRLLCCRSCNAIILMPELISDRQTISSSSNIPPDKPLGMMQLWWPQTVPYRYSRPDEPASTLLGGPRIRPVQPARSGISTSIFDISTDTEDKRVSTCLSECRLSG